MPKRPKSNVSAYPIGRHIHLVRGQKVMLDSGPRGALMVFRLIA